MVFILGPSRKQAVGRITQSWSRPQSDSCCASALRFDSILSCGTVPVFPSRLAHACHVQQPSVAIFSAEGLGFYAHRPRKGRETGRQWWNGHIKSINPCSGAGLSDTLLDWFLIRFVWTLAPPSTSAGWSGHPQHRLPLTWLSLQRTASSVFANSKRIKRLICTSWKLMVKNDPSSRPSRTKPET